MDDLDKSYLDLKDAIIAEDFNTFEAIVYANPHFEVNYMFGSIVHFAIKEFKADETATKTKMLEILLGSPGLDFMPRSSAGIGLKVIRSCTERMNSIAISNGYFPIGDMVYALKQTDTSIKQLYINNEAFKRYLIEECDRDIVLDVFPNLDIFIF